MWLYFIMAKDIIKQTFFSKSLIVTYNSAALWRATLTTSTFHPQWKLILVTSILYFMEPFLQNREINEM